MSSEYYYPLNISTYTDSCSSNSSIDFLSVLLGFFLGILFTLCSIGCGVSIAWFVNYNITRKLRKEYKPPSSNGLLDDINEYNNEMDQLSPGIISKQISLSNIEDMSPDSFQHKWESIINYREEDFSVSSFDDFQALLSSHYIFCLASGDVDNQIKYYQYARDISDKRLFLMETIIDNNTKEAKLTLKTSGCSRIDISEFINYYLHAISSIIIHPV